jgi:hypothetical protein
MRTILNKNQLDESFQAEGHEGSLHIMKLYSQKDSLCQSVARFLRAGLDVGEGAILLASIAHIDFIIEALMDLGIDVESAVSSGQIVLLEAEKALSHFIIDDKVDEVLFERVIGKAFDAMANGFPRVRAFGEMVNILCANGNYSAAIELEGLWCDLLATRSVSLMCGYDQSSFEGNAHQVAFDSICLCHTHVLPVVV